MRSILAVSSIISIIGLFFIVRGAVHPNKYEEELSKETPTAVRVTQVYTEATHFVVVGIGFISFSIFIAVFGMLFNRDDMANWFLILFRKSQKTVEADNTVDNLEKGER